MAVVTAVVTAEAVVAETATKPRHGTVNHRATTIGGPAFFLRGVIEPTILKFPTS